MIFELKVYTIRVSARQTLHFQQTWFLSILNDSHSHNQGWKLNLNLRENLEIMKNAKNSVKYRILSSFWFFLVLKHGLTRWIPNFYESQLAPSTFGEFFHSRIKILFESCSRLKPSYGSGSWIVPPFSAAHKF